MRTCVIPLTVLLAACVAVRADDVRGPLGYWDVDGGEGRVLRDRSGQGHDGEIHGAAWVECGGVRALRLDGRDDYVDCGDGPAPQLAESVTVRIWVRPEGKPSGDSAIVGTGYEGFQLTYYKDGRCYWYIASSGNHCGAALAADEWQHVAATFDGKMMKLYVNGRLEDSRKSTLERMVRRGKVLIGRGPAWFRGCVGDVRLDNRALAPEEIAGTYKSEAARHGIDDSLFDRVKVTPYCYFDRRRIVADVDCRQFLALPKDARVDAELFAPGQEKAIRRGEATALPECGEAEIALDASGLKAGRYELRVAVRTKAGVLSEDKVSLAYAPASVVVPSPKDKTVPPLPPAAGPCPFRLEIDRGGGFQVHANNESYLFESTYSYPHGGENRLSASDAPDRNDEASWAPAIEKQGDGRFRIVASGDHYGLERVIRVYPNRIAIHDTLTNRTDKAVGIIIRNHLRTAGKEFARACLAGYDTIGTLNEQASPTVFLGNEGLGIGLVPLDDVFIVQALLYNEDDLAGVGTERFALAPNDSYTLEWAVYLNASGDYYDFINAVRRDEGRAGTVDGSLALGAATKRKGRRIVPSKQYVDLMGTKYLGIDAFIRPADDPTISPDGIEFIETEKYPKEMALIREQTAAIAKAFPDCKPMFHVAHSLWATSRPGTLFPDSRVVDAAGKQPIYEYPYRTYSYFSKERIDEGWRWYIYYPTPGNSFHDALMKSADVIMDDLGCGGVFMDGFLWGYFGRYTHDRWDNHTVVMDPKTKTIARKSASVLLLSQPSMVEFTRRINAKGGVVIANNSLYTRTICKEKIIHDWECKTGPDMHLAPTAVTLLEPRSMKCQRDVYREMLRKLAWGNLTFHYGGRELTYPSLAVQMYPITFREIGAGTVKGDARIVTMRPGVYGWPGDTDLHLAYHYDPRGCLTAGKPVSTVDPAGVRTEIVLRKDESAVIEKVPLTIVSDGPVNVVVLRYDADAIELVLNGAAEVAVRARAGRFSIGPGESFRIESDGERIVKAAAKGTLRFGVRPGAQRRIVVRREAPAKHNPSSKGVNDASKQP